MGSSGCSDASPIGNAGSETSRGAQAVGLGDPLRSGDSLARKGGKVGSMGGGSPCSHCRSRDVVEPPEDGSLASGAGPLRKERFRKCPAAPTAPSARRSTESRPTTVESYSCATTTSPASRTSGVRRRSSPWTSATGSTGGASQCAAVRYERPPEATVGANNGAKFSRRMWPKIETALMKSG
jgi:hypothetical protein